MRFYFFLFPHLQTPGDSWGEIASDWFQAFVNDLWIQGLKALATTFWFLEKIGAGITRFLTEQDMWDLLLDTTIDTLSTTMPDILTNLMFSNNGAGGLAYLALFLAGILMIIPQTSHIKLVEPQQVIIWSVVVSVLFLSASGPWGYDLISAVEQMRTSAVQVILTAVDDNGEVDSLIAQPMMANDADLEDYSFILPEDFEEEYYPEPEEPDDYEERTATISSFLGMEMTFNIETEESQEERREKAEMGIAISGLTLLPGIVLLMFGFIFATLTASALLLILFFVTSLPLGFFEFGSGILTGILKQYTYLWAITLLATILPGILIAAETLAYPNSSPPTPTEMMGFIPILIIVTIATSYVSAMATSAMTDTFSVISTSISTAMAPMNYAGNMPKSGTLEGLAGGAASVVGTAALAAVTGGAGAALMAGGGALLSKTGGGETAGALATGLAGEKASVFASAAQGRGAASVAQVAGAQYQKRKKQEEIEDKEASTRYQKNTKSPTDETLGELLDAGAYRTTNLTSLSQAEEAFSAGEYVTARHHLTRAFGSRDIANQALKEYEKDGGMKKIRAITQNAQAAAQEISAAGGELFNNGQLSNEFRAHAWQRMKRKGAKNEDAELAAAISGSVIRTPLDTWDDPFAASKLAGHIKGDPTAEHPYSKDMAAAFALGDLATSEGWDERQLEALFEATKEGQVIALGGKKTGLQATTEQLRLHGEFDDSRPEAATQGARLAMLILGQTKAPPARPRTNMGQVARGLTETVLTPSDAPLVPINTRTKEQIQELNELANAQGWGQNELNALFETTLEAANQDIEGPLSTHIADRVLGKEQSFTVGARAEREQAAALAVGIAAGTMPAPPSPAPRTTPTANELTRKTLTPDSDDVLIRDEKTEKNLEKLNQLVVAEGWTGQELTPIWEAAQAARGSEEPDHLSYIAKQLHSQNIPLDDKRIRAASLALKIQDGVMLAPAAAQATAMGRDKLEKQAAQTVAIQTEQIRAQAPDWVGQEQQAGQSLAMQTQQIQNQKQDEIQGAIRESVQERQPQEKQQQQHIMTEMPMPPHAPDKDLANLWIAEEEDFSPENIFPPSPDNYGPPPPDDYGPPPPDDYGPPPPDDYGPPPPDDYGPPPDYF